MSALDPWGVELGKLALAPGETVLVRLSQPLPMAEVEWLHQRLRTILPADTTVLMLPAAITVAPLRDLPAGYLQTVIDRCQAELARRGLP